MTKKTIIVHGKEVEIQYGNPWENPQDETEEILKHMHEKCSEGQKKPLGWIPISEEDAESIRKEKEERGPYEVIKSIPIQFTAFVACPNYHYDEKTTEELLNKAVEYVVEAARQTLDCHGGSYSSEKDGKTLICNYGFKFNPTKPD